MKLLPEKLVLSDEELQSIMDLAACNFSPELVAKKLDIERSVFMHFWTNKEHDVRQAYEAGKLTAQFNIMNKQRELAESGNITAAQIFLKESKEIETNNIRNQCLFGDDN
jgi:hypothetical protein